MDLHLVLVKIGRHTQAHRLEGSTYHTDSLIAILSFAKRLWYTNTEQRCYAQKHTYDTLQIKSKKYWVSLIDLLSHPPPNGDPDNPPADLVPGTTQTRGLQSPLLVPLSFIDLVRLFLCVFSFST